MKMTVELDEIKLESDTLIHIGGMPFELRAGTPVYGLKSNAGLALQDSGNPGSNQKLYSEQKARDAATSP
jgi:hypothetical protein